MKEGKTANWYNVFASNQPGIHHSSFSGQLALCHYLTVFWPLLQQCSTGARQLLSQSSIIVLQQVYHWCLGGFQTVLRRCSACDSPMFVSAPSVLHMCYGSALVLLWWSAGAPPILHHPTTSDPLVLHCCCSVIAQTIICWHSGCLQMAFSRYFNGTLPLLQLYFICYLSYLYWRLIGAKWLPCRCTVIGPALLHHGSFGDLLVPHHYSALSFPLFFRCSAVDKPKNLH